MAKKRKDDASLPLPFETAVGMREEIETLLLSGGFEVRPKQVAMIERLSDTTQNTLFVADTGDGKSLVFLAVALLKIRSGGRVILMTTQQHLVRQFSDEARRFPELGEGAVLSVSGKIPPVKRYPLYQKNWKLLVATAPVVLNDLEKEQLPTDGVVLIGFDEVHHARKRDCYVKLCAILKPRGISRLGMTASPGESRSAQKALRYVFGAERCLIMPREVRRVKEKTIKVALYNRLPRWTEVLREEALKTWTELQRALDPRGELTLDGSSICEAKIDENGTATKSRLLPAFAEQGEVLKAIGQIKEADEKRGGKLHSLWATYGLLNWWYNDLACASVYHFAEDFSYRHAWHRIKPRVCLPELEERQRVLPRFFELSAIRNTRAWAVYAEVIQRSLYWALVRTRDGQRPRTWKDVWAAAFPDEELGKRTAQEIAREFFERAFQQRVRGGFDHPKFFELEELLSKHREVLKAGRVILFTQTRRHARFLAAAINHHFPDLGVRATWFAGAKSVAVRRTLEQQLEDFNTHVNNLAAATDAAREGVDVRRALVGITYTLPDSNPIKRLQGRGRLGRDKDVIALMIYLVTRGTAEEKRVSYSQRREKTMQKETLRFATLVFPKSGKIVAA